MLIWAKGKNGISIKKGHLQYKGMIRLDLAVVRDNPTEKKGKLNLLLILLLFTII